MRKYSLLEHEKGWSPFVVCGECGRGMREDNLEEHFRRKDHRGKEKSILVQYNEPANPVKNWKEKLFDKQHIELSEYAAE